MDVRKRWGCGMAVAALALLAVAPAYAGAKGRRNTAAVLGAAAAYEAIQGQGGAALVLGAGAIGAYGRYRDARDRERYGYYGRRYRRSGYRDRGYYDDRDEDRYRSRRYEERYRYDGRSDDDGYRYHRERGRDDVRYYLDRD
jgi:hypothetical protein